MIRRRFEVRVIHKADFFINVDFHRSSRGFSVSLTQFKEVANLIIKTELFKNLEIQKEVV